MAIESKLQLKYEGLPNPVEVAGGYTRIVGFRGSAFQETHILGNPQEPSVELTLRDWASKDGAEKVYEEEKTQLGEHPEGIADPENYKGPGVLEFEVKSRLVGVTFDPENLEHVAQYEAAGSPPLDQLDAHGNPWMATVSENYKIWTLVLQVYRGKTVLPHIQERILHLPIELALAVLSHNVPGENPQEQYDTLASELYRAAMLSGAFVDPKVA